MTMWVLGPWGTTGFVLAVLGLMALALWATG